MDLNTGTMRAQQCIEDWKQYSKESHDWNNIDIQFRELIDFNLSMAHPITKFSKCAHNKFGNFNSDSDAQKKFSELLQRFVINEDRIEWEMKRVTKKSGWNGSLRRIAPGICMSCIQKFIIETNGLRDIFKTWQDIVNDDLRWIKEFNYTNILLIRQPIFLKCLLLPSNINSLKTVFNLFFVSFLQKIDLDLVVNENIYNYSEPFDWDAFDENTYDYYHYYDVFFSNIIPENINIMHGIEYSLCSLSTTVNSLIPLLKLNHIQHLFINNKPLNNIAIIFDKFIAQYVSMPHIAMHYSTKNLNEFTGLSLPLEFDECQTDWYHDYHDEKKERNEIWKYWVEDNHSFVHQLLTIIIRVYTKLKHYYKKIIKKNHISDESFIKQLRVEVMLFERLMYHTPNYSKDNTIKDFLWNLAANMVPYYSNRKEAMRCNYWINCTVCHRERTDEKNTFKVCSNCKVTYYCGRKCQKYDWNRNHHKQNCQQLVLSMSR